MTTAAIVVTLIAINTLTQLQLVRERVTEKTDSLGALIREVTLPYLLEDRPAELDIIFEELARQPDVHSLSFIDPDGMLLVTSESEGGSLFLAVVDDPLVELAQATRTRQLQTGGGLLHAAVPALYGLQNYGTIRYTLETRMYRSGVSVVLFRNALFGLVFTAGSILMSMAIAKRLASPLERLNRATRKAASGDLDQFIDIRTNDEVESLSRSFNTMLSNLRARWNALEDAQERLEEFSRNLNSKNGQLATALQQARSAEAAKTEFLASMSHEIRTPMNGVLGMAELLAETRLDQHQARLLDTITSSGRSLLNIINDILDFSKIEAGHMAIRNEPFRVSDLVEDTGRILALQAAQKDVELVTRCDPRLPVFMNGDFARMKQVVMNFASNAVKFTDHGHVLIRARLVRDADRRKLLRIDVQDTGCGIPENKIDLVFGRFTQIDGSYSRKYEGTGLGLAISKGFVGLMGGRIDVRSKPGKGSVFSFTVPLIAVDGQDESAPGLTGLKGARALLVTSHATLRDSVRERLEAVGLQVTPCRTGQMALKLLAVAHRRCTPFTQILVDDRLPDIGGQALSTQIGTLPGAAGRRVIVFERICQLARPGALPDGMASGRLLKPLIASQLIEALIQSPARAKDSSPGRRGKHDRTAPQSAAAPGMVLVVDDNRTNSKLLELILKKQDVSFVTAANGAEAVEQFEEYRPDLVFMDISMPVMNGLEAAQRIRAIEVAAPDVAARCRIIGLTAHSTPQDRRACLDSGMDDHMTKPVKLAAIRGEVASMHHPLHC